MAGSSFHLDFDGSQIVADVTKLAMEKLKDVAEETVSIAKSDHTFQNRTGINEASISWDEESNKRIKVFTQSGYGGYVELKMPYIFPAFEKAKHNLGK